jgi:hypothetical protein
MDKRPSPVVSAVGRVRCERPHIETSATGRALSGKPRDGAAANGRTTILNASFGGSEHPILAHCNRELCRIGQLSDNTRPTNALRLTDQDCRASHYVGQERLGPDNATNWNPNSSCNDSASKQRYRRRWMQGSSGRQGKRRIAGPIAATDRQGSYAGAA